MPTTKPVYLCGPINGRSDYASKSWREQAKTLLPTTIDPMRNDYRGRELEPGVAKLIVETDKLDIINSHALLVYFDEPSVGTPMEIMFAWSLKIPVYVVNASDKPLSPWLVYHATAIYDSLVAACAAIV